MLPALAQLFFFVRSPIRDDFRRKVRLAVQIRPGEIEHKWRGHDRHLQRPEVVIEPNELRNVVAFDFMYAALLETQINVSLSQVRRVSVKRLDCPYSRLAVAHGGQHGTMNSRTEQWREQFKPLSAGHSEGTFHPLVVNRITHELRHSNRSAFRRCSDNPRRQRANILRPSAWPRLRHPGAADGDPPRGRRTPCKYRRTRALSASRARRRNPGERIVEDKGACWTAEWRHRRGWHPACVTRFAVVIDVLLACSDLEPAQRRCHASNLLIQSWECLPACGLEQQALTTAKVVAKFPLRFPRGGGENSLFPHLVRSLRISASGLRARGGDDEFVA